MTLGDDIKAAVLEMITQDGNFGSLVTVRHNARTQDVSTGQVTVTSTESTIRGAISDAISVQPFFDQSTLSSMRTAVVIHSDSLTQEINLHDEVSISAGEFLRVLDVSEFRGPGDSGRAVSIAYILALGT